MEQTKNMQITCISPKTEEAIEFSFENINDFLEEMVKKEDIQDCTDVIVHFVDTGKEHRFYTIKEAIVYYGVKKYQKYNQ